MLNLQLLSITDAKIERILSDPATSYWLKRAVTSARERDVVDAFNDAVTLLRVIQADWEAIGGRR